MAPPLAEQDARGSQFILSILRADERKWNAARSGGNEIPRRGCPGYLVFLELLIKPAYARMNARSSMKSSELRSVILSSVPVPDVFARNQSEPVPPESVSRALSSKTVLLGESL